MTCGNAIGDDDIAAFTGRSPCGGRDRATASQTAGAKPDIHMGAGGEGVGPAGRRSGPTGGGGRFRRGVGRPDPMRSARLGSARLGSARLGSARLGSARLGSARLGSARLGSARLGSARLGSARLGSARLGSARQLYRKRYLRMSSETFVSRSGSNIRTHPIGTRSTSPGARHFPRTASTGRSPTVRRAHALPFEWIRIRSDDGDRMLDSKRTRTYHLFLYGNQ